MPSYILVGNKTSFEKFIDDFKIKESIKEIDTHIYEDKFLIESSRSLIKSLALKSNSKRLFILKNEITLEAQNSLLKNLEELDSLNAIIFCTNTLGELLPTIHSRCRIVNLKNNENLTDQQLMEKTLQYINKEISMWELIDKLEEMDINKDINILLINLRQILLENDNSIKEKAFYFCKNYLKHYQLIEKNNINKRIALERILTA